MSETYSEPTPPAPARVRALREELTHLAALLAEEGVPAEVLLGDVRAGIAITAGRRGRSGR